MTRRIFGIALLTVAVGGGLAAQDLESVLATLKGAEAQKDIEQVKTLAVQAIELGSKAARRAEPADAAAKAAWKEEVDFARSVDSYGQYALYTAALSAPAKTKVDLLSTLEKASPKSKYLDDGGYTLYFAALRETGAEAQIPAIAEKGLASLPESDDLLLVLVNSALTKGQSDRALTYANRLVGAMTKHPKPESLSAADWEQRRNTALGTGYLIAGLISGQKGQLPQADKNLRAALPLIRGNSAQAAQALFTLGLVNYQIGKATNSKARILEAANFSAECAKITNPQADQAYRNSLAMRDEASKMR